ASAPAEEEKPDKYEIPPSHAPQKPDESKAFAVIEGKFFQISLTLLNFVFVKAITSICLVVRI
ncbi:unnamed protein product, partial [Prunus brigantina]